MIKLIVGKKGSGKTKTLIDLVNAALSTTKGSVVCIEKGNKLNFEINYQCRLIDTDEYLVTDGQSLYGFIAGILASNHDVTDIFVDSALKICQNDEASFDVFLNELEAILKTSDINFVITSSVAAEEASDTVKKFIVE
ncbi:MAG: ATP-binding protein [Clostridia bacterium]|nr:ATP-binding protein [Clostridia bacterium]